LCVTPKVPNRPVDVGKELGENNVIDGVLNPSVLGDNYRASHIRGVGELLLAREDDRDRHPKGPTDVAARGGRGSLSAPFDGVKAALQVDHFVRLPKVGDVDIT